VELQRSAILPLGVGHLEQVDLWHGSSYVKQGVDSAEAIERGLYDGVD
jgi:hypothetical protein